MKPFRLFNQTHIHRINQQIACVLQSWNERYALHELNFSLEIHFPQPVDEPLEFIDPAMQITSDWPALFSYCLFENTDSAFNPTARKAGLELFSLICPHTFEKTSSTQSWFYKGSTCMKIHLYCHNHCAELFLHPDWLYTQFSVKKSESKALTPLSHALHSKHITLETQLQPFSISLQTLLGIEEGDVLSTDHLLLKPLLLTCNNHPVAEAALGMRENHKSISLERVL